MQAVILAAGRGTRMKELTENAPKALLEVMGKPLLEYEFDALPNNVDEAIIIVGYMGSAIQKRYGGTYKDKRILYIEQDTLDGTAGALWRAQTVLKDRFLVLMSDDIYSKDDTIRCEESHDWTMLVDEVEHMQQGGCVTIDKRGDIVSIEEGSHGGKRGFISTNMFALDTRLFQFPMIPKAEGSPEFGLPQTVLAASRTGNIPFRAVKASRWIQITNPEDLKKAEELLAS